jgi:tetratricopeptide (TPR) repeat protein
MGSLRAPLLGRAAELAEIEQRLARVRAGATETLIVIAPPGVGKTRLVEELAERASGTAVAAPMALLRARLGPDTISVAAAVAQLAGSAAADGTEAQRGLLVDGGDDGDSAAGQVRDLEAEREARFRAWIAALDALAGARPGVWLIEDLHWSGGDLLAFIEQAARQPAASGRLILGTGRPSLRDDLGRRSADGAALPVFELPPLAAAGARELVGALVGEALPESLISAIVERSDGTPLFIEELLRAWVSVGTLAIGPDGRWRLTAEPDAVALPQTVQQIYAAQLDDLPDDARALVRRASVAGRRVPRDSLPTLDLGQSEAALEITRRRALLVDGRPDSLYGAALSYRHALLRDAGYASLARAERGRLHARLAAWYEGMAGGRADEVAEQIANHYDAAIEHASRLTPEIDAGLDVARARDLAVEWYRRAAVQALSAAAHEAARSFLRRALSHVDESAPLMRAGLLLALGEATAYTADMDEGATLLGQAVELYRAALDDGAADAAAGNGTEAGATAAVRTGYAAAAAALGRVWIQQVRFDSAAKLADEALTRLGDDGSTAIAPLLGIRGWVKATLTVDREALADIDRALDIARGAADRRLELELKDWRAGALGELDEYDVADWQDIERLAVELGDWQRAVKAMRMQAGQYLDDQPGLVWPLADRVEEIGRRRGLEEDLCWIDYLRTEAGFVAGEWDRAVAAGLRAFDLGERNGYDRAVVRTLHVLLPIASARGEREIVERAFAWHAPRRHMFPDSPYARIMEAAIGLHCAAAGLQPPVVPEVAPRLIAFDAEPGGPSWVAALETVVEAWLAAGEVGGAHEAVSLIEHGAATHPTTSSLGRGVAAYLRSRVSGAQGDVAAEAAQARTALGHFRNGGAAWWIWKCLRARAVTGNASADERAEMNEIAARLRLAARP